MKKNFTYSFLVIIYGILLSRCQPDTSSSQSKVDFTHKALHANEFPDEWLLNGGNYKEHHFSPLKAIHKDNVKDLGLAWYMDLPRDGSPEATPLMIDGVLYFTSAWSRVYAVNAASGKKLWTYDPKVPKSTQYKACCGPVNRGVAFWNDKIYVGAVDGRLIALDAKTGNEAWSVNTLENVNNYSPNNSYTITGAPRIAGDKIVIGNGGGEFGVRGFVTAYDAQSGKLAWRFYTVPGDPSKPFENPILEMAAKTWNGEWWKYGGGGTAWDAMVYDPELNLLFIGVGNGSPWNPNIRSAGEGDNLFISSIVAVRADNGEYVWHYQTTPGDAWDYTATQNMILTELEIDGKERKVLMQAPKNGFFYVLDRENGELISADAFSKITWASHVDMETGRPVIQEEAKYWKTGKPTPLYPNAGGAHNWFPMAFNPEHGLVYIPTSTYSSIYSDGPIEEFNATGRNTGMKFGDFNFPKDPKMVGAFIKTIESDLLAWDPIQKKEVWRLKQNWANHGGVLATAGDLVFQGTLDGKFKAMHALTGEILWSFDAMTSVRAAPITYAIDNEQYIAVLVGKGGTLIGGRIAGDVSPEGINRARMLVFKLGAKEKLPPADEITLNMPDLSDQKIDEHLMSLAMPPFERHCMECHGLNAVGNSIVPDLRYSAYLQNKESWYKVVGEGLLEKNGMVGFEEILSKDEIEGLRHYVIYHNQQSRIYGDTTRISR